MILRDANLRFIKRAIFRLQMRWITSKWQAKWKRGQNNVPPIFVEPSHPNWTVSTFIFLSKCLLSSFISLCMQMGVIFQPDCFGWSLHRTLKVFYFATCCALVAEEWPLKVVLLSRYGTSKMALSWFYRPICKSRRFPDEKYALFIGPTTIKSLLRSFCDHKPWIASMMDPQK